MSEMNENSLLAYYTEVQPQLTEREQEVLDALQFLKIATMHQIADHLNRPVHAVSGRFTALKKKERIEDSGKPGLSPGGNPATIWQLKVPVQKVVGDYIDTIIV